MSKRNQLSFETNLSWSVLLKFSHNPFRLGFEDAQIVFVHVSSLVCVFFAFDAVRLVSRIEEKRLKVSTHNSKSKEAQSKNEYVKGKCPL